MKVNGRRRRGRTPKCFRKKIHVYIGKNRTHQKNQKITGCLDKIRIVFNLFPQII